MVVGSAEVMGWQLAIWIALYNIPRLKGTPIAIPINVELQRQVIRNYRQADFKLS